ncbi:cbb3-type cytochrome c oxidase subunit II, partial [Acinetobacter baumannii]|uniref:cbb3-type cytochrome c oxidase subunit II n=1 Tax=Acinetobacter baumannii TaxID=470 RepID=UPI0013D4CAEE
LDLRATEGHLEANRAGGVPYSPEQIAKALEDLRTQVDPDSPNLQAFQARYPGAVVRNFGGRTGGVVSEMDALVAYLQVLGTMVD